MKDTPQSAKRRRYDAAFRTEVLRLASESRSTQAAARALNIDPKRHLEVAERVPYPRGGGPWSGVGSHHRRRVAPAARR